jgi:hypothetical protein
MVGRLVGITFAAWLSVAPLAGQATPDLMLVGFTGSPLVSPSIVVLETPELPALGTRPPSERFAATTVLAGLFGAIGFVGGAVMGAGTGDGDDYGGLITGAYVGGWLGGGLGGSIASGRPAQSFLGSAVGLVPGTLLLYASEDAGGSMLFLAPLAHGLVTAAFTQMRR